MKFYVATTMLVLAATVMGAAYPEPNDAAAADCKQLLVSCQRSRECCSGLCLLGLCL
ncbi:hypothetical protein VE03_09754 [Pseudogymnoascus sp. 23342-1-I1]|nr:hypothetical protein VE03_09754 [Pseudogymnoascus sp. 23342-1-I1]